MKNPNVVAPESVDVLQKWVAERVQSQTPFAIRGSQSRSVSPQLDVLSTKNLKGLRFFDPDDMVVGVEAGLTVGALQAHLKSKNMVLEVNPWFAQSTIGSVVACNDYGPNRLNSGGLRDHIIGIEYVNGRGELVKGGGKVVKNVTGYDLNKMMLGGVGGLGVITSINFKVLPLKTEPWTLLAHYTDEQWKGVAQKIHEQRLTVDWLQVYSTGFGWVLGVGFSGNEARRTRILQELEASVPSIDKCHAETYGTWDLPVCPGNDRHHGFLTSFMEALEMSHESLHIHAMLPTGALMKQISFQDLRKKGCQLVIHPVGADFHVMLSSNDVSLQQEVLEMLEPKLSGSEGKVNVLRCYSELDLQKIHSLRLPPGYSLMQALKQTIDPAGVFHAPFYEI